MVSIIAIISNEDYSVKIFDIIKQTASSADNALLVSLNKTYKSVLQSFEEQEIDKEKFYFIDTITASLIKPPDDEHCIYLDDPNSIKKLYAAIIKTVKKHNIDMVVFDSLSSLTTYQDPKQILHFVSTLLGSLNLLNSSAVFTCLGSDADKPLIQQVRMKVDKSMDMK